MQTFFCAKLRCVDCSNKLHNFTLYVCDNKFSKLEKNALFSVFAGLSCNSTHRQNPPFFICRHLPTLNWWRCTPICRCLFSRLCGQMIMDKYNVPESAGSNGTKQETKRKCSSWRKCAFLLSSMTRELRAMKLIFCSWQWRTLKERALLKVALGGRGGSWSDKRAKGHGKLVGRPVIVMGGASLNVDFKLARQDTTRKNERNWPFQRTEINLEVIEVSCRIKCYHRDSLETSQESNRRVTQIT